MTTRRRSPGWQVTRLSREGNESGTTPRNSVCTTQEVMTALHHMKHKRQPHFLNLCACVDIVLAGFSVTEHLTCTSLWDDGLQCMHASYCTPGTNLVLRVQKPFNLLYDIVDGLHRTDVESTLHSQTKMQSSNGQPFRNLTSHACVILQHIIR